VFVGGKEYFLPYQEFPWFNNATLAQILEVTILHGHHLRWEELDVDLDLRSLQQPEAYPLVYV
jgi:hypothetical protein